MWGGGGAEWQFRKDVHMEYAHMPRIYTKNIKTCNIHAYQEVDTWLNSYQALSTFHISFTGLKPRMHNSHPWCSLSCEKSTAPPKQVLYRKRSSAPSLKFQYLLFSFRSSSRCLCLLPCLHTPPIFPSKVFRQQYLHKMWPIQLAFPCLTVCRMFPSSLPLNNICPFFTWLVQLVFSILLQHHT
jgi:hypothetical protein